VLYLYGNYAGDNMNFDIAAEMARDEGIRTHTIRIWDDVASAPPERMEDRRGIAGDLLIIKIAGGVSAVADDLEEVARVTTKARDRTRSMGVAVAAGSIPETGEPTFELPDNEIEIGMGLHGEAGVSREKLLPADALVEKMMDRLLPDLPFARGDEVCLLINDLGATTMMELLIVNRKTHAILDDKGIAVHDTLIGSYCTSQEMAGFSISLMRLDDELKTYYDMPARSFGFTKA
jgi:dihydroxyacetone kinase-like protein